MVPSRKTETYVRNGTDVDLDLIREVKKYEVLYTRGHPDYNGKYKGNGKKYRDAAWKMISEELQISPQDAHARWRRLRDRFVRGRKKILTDEGCGGAPLSSVLHKEMSFLSDFIYHKELETYCGGDFSEQKGKRKKKKIYNQSSNLIPAVKQKSKCKSQKRKALGNDDESSSGRKQSAKLPKDEDTKPAIANMKPSILPGMHDYAKSNLYTKDIKPIVLPNMTDSVISYPVKHTVETSCIIIGDEHDVQMDHNLQVKLDQDIDKHHENRKYMEDVEMESDEDIWSNDSISCYNIEDEDKLFCRSVVATIKKFNPKMKAFAKAKIQQILYEFECSDLPGIISVDDLLPG